MKGTTKTFKKGRNQMNNSLMRQLYQEIQAIDQN